MKIFIKQGDKEFSLDAGNAMVPEDISEFIIKINKELFGNSCSGHCSCHSTKSDQTQQDSVQLVQPTQRDEFSIRQRLPNNVVDINDLTIKEAIMESVLVRCPNCGQSHAIILRDGPNLYLMKRSYDTEEFDIVAQFSADDRDKLIDRYCADGDTLEQKLDYFYRVHSMIPKIEKDFNVSEHSEIFCPVCRKSADFFLWKDAYANKERYFEHEYICGVCGSECVMDAQDEKDGKGVVVCTKCGKRWIKEQVK